MCLLLLLYYNTLLGVIKYRIVTFRRDNSSYSAIFLSSLVIH